MMSKPKKCVNVKWNGGEVSSYYENWQFSRKIKFYTSFIKNGASYSTGDYVLTKDGNCEKIGWLKCLYEDTNGKCEALIFPYEFAKNFKTNFARLSIDFHDTNEVVLIAKEVTINLEQIERKCRVINGTFEDTVEDIIYSNNLNENIYFLCRFQYIESGKFVSVLDNINWESKTDLVTINLEETPRKSSRSRKQLYTLKNITEKMEIDDSDLMKNNVEHVRRNLNVSFNDSQDEEQSKCINYSIIEQNDDNLKIKLKVSNGKVLSKIPSTQPIVLMERIHKTPEKKRTSVIYELKSPSFNNAIKTSLSVPAKLRRSTRRVSTPKIFQDLSSLVDDLKLNDKSPSPRKLRKITRVSYLHSESEDEETMKNTKRQTKDEQFSPKKLRRSTVRYSDFFYDDEPIKRTPTRKSITNRRISKLISPSKKSTPSKLLREGLLTPTMDNRKKNVVKPNTPLVLARNNLHVSYVPTILPCREKEYEDIYTFIEGKLLDKCGGCMYISGVPGTGKTATVTSAIANLTSEWKEHNNPEFNFISINGMKLTEPRQCYVEILNQLTGKRKPWEQALENLGEIFTAKKSRKTNNVPTVLLIDELDILCTKRQDVVYNLLDWPTKPNAQLIVITIANTMDLPERLLMSRVTSRLGLTRLTFQAYTHKQLQEIVSNRLTGNNSFKSDAVQFVARKVASVSGDARRALDICRRSAEIAESEGPNTQVTMKHINAALEAMLTQPKIKAISHCSKLEKLLLQSVIAEVERTGVEETTLNDVYTMLTTLSALDGFKMVSISLAASAIYRLNSCKLLLAEQKCVDLSQKIILNISSDDVYYALKKN